MKYFLSEYLSKFRQHLYFSSTDVMTPVSLARDMVGKLFEEMTEDPSVLKSKKFLDPACGTGVFLAVTFDHLFYLLVDEIPDNEERARHILENQLYGVDVNQVKLKLAKRFLDHEDRFDLNLICDDSLERDWNMKFDVVVGNPPYQLPKSNQGGSVNSWSKFVKKSEEVTKYNGFISLIHPGSWKSYATPNRKSLLRDFFKRYNLLHLEVETASQYFSSIGSTFDWYVIRKNESIQGPVKIKTTDGSGHYQEFESSLENMPCIPQVVSETSFNVTKKIVAEEQKLQIINDHKFDTRRDYVRSEKNTKFVHPLRHYSQNVKWSSKKHPDQHEKKVLMSQSGYLKPEYDPGKYGVTQGCLYIKVKDQAEGQYILSLIKSKLFTYFRNVNKWSGFFNQYLLREMPYIKGLDLKNIDQELYKYFNLSDDEIQEIEEFVS